MNRLWAAGVSLDRLSSFFFVAVIAVAPACAAAVIAGGAEDWLVAEATARADAAATGPAPGADSTPCAGYSSVR